MTQIVEILPTGTDKWPWLTSHLVSFTSGAAVLNHDIYPGSSTHRSGFQGGPASRSNWNLEMLVFEERGENRSTRRKTGVLREKPGVPGEKPE